MVKQLAASQFADGSTEDSVFWKVFQAATDPILLTGNDYRVRDCNPAALQQLGYSDKALLIGRSVGDFSPPRQPDGQSSAEKATANVAQLLRDGHIRFEWVHQRVDGSLFDTEVSAMTIKWQGEQVLYAQWRDLSAQQQLLQNLRENEETSRRIFEASADAITIFKQGVLIDFNKAAAHQLDTRRGQS